MMKYIPVDVFDCVSDNLDIISVVQLAKVCKDTQFLTEKAKTIVIKQATLTTKHVINEMLKVYNVLTSEQKRHDIAKEIATNVLQSAMATRIVDTICMSCYEMTGEIHISQTIFNMLEKVQNDSILTDIEKKTWKMFQNFWLGSDFYVSVIITSKETDVDVLMQLMSSSKLSITILKPGKETVCCDFDVWESDDIISFIITSAGKRFCIDATFSSGQIIRDYTFSKTPSSFDRLYHVYLHIKDIQKPFLQLMEDMKKNIRQ
jgi:hypothetical protein